jgi:L-asparaginase
MTLIWLNVWNCVGIEAGSTGTDRAKTRDMPQERQRLHIIFTGGTISMTASHTGAVPTLTGSDIFQAIPTLQQRFNLDFEDFGKFPGPHMTVERMVQLHLRVQAAIAAGAEGIVITHGTDTLEETAYLLDLLHTEDVPVVLVGAMRTSDDLSWDGPINLYAACLVAASQAARGHGVMVVMNNTIQAASEVNKTFTEAVDTFASPDCGPLGLIDVGEVFMYRQSACRRTFPFLPEKIARVEVLLATAGSDAQLVDAAVNSGSQGLVIAAMGRGNVPPAMAQAIKRAIDKGVVVVVTSRCWGGRVAPVYGYEGGGAQLAAMGALFAPWLNSAKARLCLSLGLGGGLGAEQLRKLLS